MKKIQWIVIGFGFFLLISFGIAAQTVPLAPMLAQVPFASWPTLYDTAENLVVKRAVDDQGNPIDEMYFRIGWGPCLVVRSNEWQTLINDTPDTGYMNMRDYADSKYFTVNDHPHFDINCPAEPDPSVPVEEYVFQ